ncbi:MAG: sulfurtransferase [Lutibacter sp.]|nr:MAG: sulfurtransferase [Lutibacter sp.]
MMFFNLFKKKNTMNDIQEYLKRGAVVVDVRTQAEWDEGHVEGSRRIELGLIPIKLDEIKAYNKPVIVVCRSGTRSGQAMQHLSKYGIDVINGGAWQNLL